MHFLLGVTFIELLFSDKQSCPSNPVQMGTCEPYTTLYHAVLIYDKDDEDDVLTLQTRLNNIVLRHGIPVKVALLNDIEADGETEIASFDACFKQCVLFFLFITEPFMQNRYEKWKYEVGLTISLAYGSHIDRERFVIPIFTDNKDTAGYLKDKHTLTAVSGITYRGCEWNEGVERSFRKNLEKAQERRHVKLNGTSVDQPD